jgi:hypothetical protein
MNGSCRSGFADRHATMTGMSATRIVSVATAKGRRLLIGSLVALAASTVGGSAPAAEQATLKATYYITIAGFTIGRADVESRFSDSEYTAAISGSTYGLSRIVSDSHAVLTGKGRISGTRVIPAAYTLTTEESGFETHVSMTMQGGSIVDLQAEPALRDVPDRVPVTSGHKRRVVDPVGAFVVVLDRPGPADGKRVCNRTVPVFDGWQRYDVKLYHKETKSVSGRGSSYSGTAIICGARYVPVAGHRPSREAIQYMANNKRLEVWLAPIKSTALLVPYRIVIGTKIGDLIINAKNFVVTATEQQARAD